MDIQSRTDVRSSQASDLVGVTRHRLSKGWITFVRKPTGNIGFVSELCYHTLDNAKVPVEHTIQAMKLESQQGIDC